MQKFYLRKLRTEIFEKYHKIKKIVHMNFDVNEKKKQILLDNSQKEAVQNVI